MNPCTVEAQLSGSQITEIIKNKQFPTNGNNSYIYITVDNRIFTVFSKIIEYNNSYAHLLICLVG